MRAPKSFTSLCTPSKVYFVLSVLAIVIALYNKFQLSAIAIKAVFVLFWTYILNLLCKNGHKGFSWFLVLLPYIIVLLLLFLNLLKRREGMTGTKKDTKDAKKAKPNPAAKPAVKPAAKPAAKPISK